jgi:hypothetical protein
VLADISAECGVHVSSVCDSPHPQMAAATAAGGSMPDVEATEEWDEIQQFEPKLLAKVMHDVLGVPVEDMATVKVMAHYVCKTALYDVMVLA